MKLPSKHILSVVFFCLLAACIFTITHEKTPSIEAAAVIPFQDDHITFNIPDYPAKALHATTFSLQAVNNPQLLHGADITIELEMLNMLCGVVTFKAVESSNSIFEGEGIPLMPGIWKATATIHWEDRNDRSHTERISRQFKVIAASTS